MCPVAKLLFQTGQSWIDAANSKCKQTPRRTRGSYVTPQPPFRPRGQPRHFHRPASGHSKNFKIQAPNGPFSNPTRPAVDGSDRADPRARGAALEGTRLGRPIRRPSPRAHYKTSPFLGHQPIHFIYHTSSPLSLIGTAPRFCEVNAGKSLSHFFIRPPVFCEISGCCQCSRGVFWLVVADLGISVVSIMVRV